MRAWQITRTTNLFTDESPLSLNSVNCPSPQVGEVLIQVKCCGVCHTELDELEGRTPPSKLPMIPGHQVVGIVQVLGDNTTRFDLGERVGVGWIFSTCGSCEFCLSGRENLCHNFVATGRDQPGGYADFMVVPERFAYKLPAGIPDVDAAPMLCAGAIGYRSLKLAGIADGETLGLTGFGASAHLVLAMVRHCYPRTVVYVFTRSAEERKFAVLLGANWTGDSSAVAPSKCDAIIDTTPAWSPILSALLQLKPGGRLVVNAIRKEANDISSLISLRYQDHLWMEKELKTVANVTRSDTECFLQLAATIPIKPEVQCYGFDQANEALVSLKREHTCGAKVLVI